MGKLADAGINFDEMETAVTEALFAFLSGDGEGWDDLAQEEKDGIRNSAITCAKASMDWLKSKGVAMIPPGAFKHPASREEAEHMTAAGMSWLKANPPKIVKPGIILPGVQ